MEGSAAEQASNLPLWIVYLFGGIGAAFGAGLYSFSLMKKNFGSGSSASRGSSADFQLAGALVDNTAVEKLSGEVAGQSIAITAQTVAIKKQTEAMIDQTRAVRELHGEIKDMSEIHRSITDLGTQIARMNR